MFLSLVADIGPRFREPWSRLPRWLRRRLEQSFAFTPVSPIPGQRRRHALISPPWDNLTANQRRLLAVQWDVQFNPNLSSQQAEAAFTEGFEGGRLTSVPAPSVPPVSIEIARDVAALRTLLERQISPAKDDAPAVTGERDTPPRRPAGRPAEWDWDAAMAHLTAEANTPDGLPAVQADAERIVERYFADRNEGRSPAASGIRAKVGQVYQAVAQKKAQCEKRAGRA